MYKKGTKIVASMLAFMMMFTYFSVIGEVVASSLEAQTTTTNNANVEFDAYLIKDEEQTHSTIQTIGEENYLYTKIQVKEVGYLKNASILVEDANFKILDTIESENVSKVEDNKISLNQIKNGNSIEIAIPIQNLQSDTINVEEFNKQNTIKLTGTYVDGNGKEKAIEKDITIQLAWTASKEANLDMQISKFVPYEVESQKNVLLQTIVKSYLKDNTLPVTENKIEIDVPTISGIKPEEIKVIANTTKATNGEVLAESFTSSNYSYNEETNKLTIKVENIADENGNISWNKDSEDEFVITYVYKNVEIGEEGKEISLQANSELTIYEASQTKATRSISSQTILKEQISNLVDFVVETDVTELSKAQIYANYNASRKIETTYQEKVIANIGLAEVTDKITIEQNEDNFVTTDETRKLSTSVSGNNYAYNKELIISKTNFDKILGQEGYIKLYNGETLITTIDKNLVANEEGNLVVDLAEYNTNSLKIETSKPQTEGKLEITINKAIKGEIGYTISQMKNVGSLELSVAGKALNGENTISEQIVSKSISFTEPTSQAEITIDNSNLSTVVTNQNTKITAILKTDTLNCMLYKNPTLKITMPSYIESINIKNVEVLFETEGSKLTLKDDYTIVENADKTKTIVINLEGTQTEYTLGAMSKGVNVVITSDIIVNKLTPNKQDQIKMIYTNNNTETGSAETKEVATNINFVAPTGVITTTSVSNYADGKEDLTSISGEEKIALIETIAPAKNVTYTMNVINNYNNTIDTISILGRTPFKGNKEITTGKDLETTMNMPLTSLISVSGVDLSKVKVYYSENENATKDVSLAENAWTLTPSSLENVKSYLIVLEDITMNTADTITYTYQAQVPANLQHNESASENYVVYFNNNLATGKVEDKVSSTKLEITTGTGPVLEANMSSNIEETQEVKTGKFIKYTLSVKNTGKQVAENVVASVELPSAVTNIQFENGESGYYTENNEKTLTFELGNIEVNKTQTRSFWVIVDNLEVEDICTDESHYEEFEGVKYHKSEFTHEDSEFKTTISTKATITATDLAKPVTSNEAKNTLTKAYFKIQGESNVIEDTILAEGDELSYNYRVSLYDTDRTAENTIVTMVIPEGLTYQSAKIRTYNLEEQKAEDITDGISYNEKARTLTINLGQTTNGAKGIIEINTIVDKLEQGVMEKQFNAQISVKADGIAEETSNILVATAAKEDVKITQTSTITEGETITTGEDFSYVYEVENIGGKATGRLTFKMVIPSELCYENTTLQIGDYKTNYYSINDDNSIEVRFALEKGQTAKIIVNVYADEIEENKTIESKATISSTNIEEKVSNSISHIVEAANYEDGEEIETITRRIVGQVWKDENNDGIKDEEETKLPGVEVMLFNNETGKLVMDSQNNVLKETTKEDGTYTFTNIPAGKYTIIFLYDTANYSATTYRKANVDDTKNSDAIDAQITLDGITRTAAITEQIVISDKNIYNIDLGLITNPKFDLKLDKTVSKITVQDSNGTKVYDYNDTKLAKKDLVGKDVNNTTIIVEYKIKVTNEGAVAGYVKKIVDYMPTEMKFNSELNRDWYISENGAIYNSSLANTIIEPGESKEVTLLLTKKMTEDNLGLYNNTAEIYEAYNDLGIADVDSTAGNKLSNEDDMSSADVLITVKTGETILFIGLTISIISTIGIGAYIIKKKVLR